MQAVKEIKMISRSKLITLPDFHATKLNNNRDIYVYLPEGYDEESDTRYPVLYMQDGQNCFDNGKSCEGRSWLIDKVTDKLIEENKIEKIIIVGIPFVRRSIEYCYYTWKNRQIHWDNGAGFEYSIDGLGTEYADFVINELKPYIDANYRTKTDSDNTALMGSSDGAFITFNMGIRHPEVFGNLAVMSPALFAMDMDFLDRTDIKNRMIWIDTGEKEACLNEDARKMVRILLNKGMEEGKDLFFYYEPDGEHTEQQWGKRVNSPLTLFFGQAGQPQSVNLYSDDVLSLKDTDKFINPVITYNTGVTRSDYCAVFTNSNSDVLTIGKAGELVPLRPGKTEITYTINNITEKREIVVDPELSDKVELSFTVQVPESTPDNATVGIDTYSPLNFKLERTADGLYVGKVKVMRGLNCNYMLRCLCNTGLYREHGTSIRHFRATENLEINCKVESWGN